MPTTYKAIYKRYNGTDWDTFYFATRADQVAEITTGDDANTRRFVTASQKTAIADYLVTFNAANKLLKLDANGKIPAAQLTPGADQTEYVARNNGTFTGELNAGTSGANINMKQGELQFGYGTPSGSLAKWKMSASGLNFRLWHDIGSGMTTSILIDPNAVSVVNKKIRDVANPEIGTDAANKEYVDNLIAVGLEWKAPVKAASIGNIDISAALSKLDNYTVADGDRILLKNQTTVAENGVYTLNASKVPQRTIDDAALTDLGHTVFVENGDTNNDSVYHCNAANTWVLVSKTDTITASTGLRREGNDIRIKDEGVESHMIKDYAITVGTKLAAFGSSDTIPTWTDPSMGDASSVSQLTAKINRLFSAIKLLRGTDDYNTNNQQTIAGAYLKNRTYRGDTAPASTPGQGQNWVSGDLYFEGVAI